MKQIIIVLLASLVWLTFPACVGKKEKDKKKKMEVPKKDEMKKSISELSPFQKLMNNEKERTRLWRAAIDSGDCHAYNKISVAYLMTYNEVELYYYSLIMANKYHCPEAYFNMSTILTHEVSTPSTGAIVINSHDRNTQNLAFYYLFKAKELGSELAKQDVDEEFGHGKNVPNSSFFLKKLMTDR